MNFFQGNFLRYEMEIERHPNYTACFGCDGNSEPEFPTIQFQMALVPANQIKAEKAIGLMRK